MEYDLRHGVQNLEANGICPVIKALYKTNPGHSEPWTHILSLRMSDPARAVNLYRPCAHLSQEDVVAKVFAKHGLRLDVDMSAGRVAKNPSHPYIRASSWIKAMDAGGNLGNLLGLGPGCSTLEQAAPALRSFLDKYALWHSDHEVYSLARAGKLSLEQCVPVYVHGDEGTAFKRDGALVLSFFFAYRQRRRLPKGRGYHRWQPPHEFPWQLLQNPVRDGNTFQGPPFQTSIYGTHSSFIRLSF